MSANHHTPYIAGTRFRPSEMNAPLGELDAAIAANAADISTIDGRVTDVESGIPSGGFGSMAAMDHWTGTQAEYDLLGTYSATTFYFVEEEVSS